MMQEYVMLPKHSGGLQFQVFLVFIYANNADTTLMIFVHFFFPALFDSSVEVGFSSFFPVIFLFTSTYAGFRQTG